MNMSLRLLCLFLMLIGASAAAAQSGIAGKWLGRELSIKVNQDNCSMLDTIDLGLDLLNGPNNTATGLLTRTIISNPGAARNSKCFTLAGTIRSDSWSAQVTPEGAGKFDLNGTIPTCLVGCDIEVPLPPTLSLILKRDENYLRGGWKNMASSSLVFERKNDMEQAEYEAAMQFLPLHRVMFKGECNRFYVEILAPETRILVSQLIFFNYCSGMAKLIPAVISDKAAFQRRVHRGLYKGMIGIHIVQEGDVLVERLLTVSEDGGNIFLVAVLRKQHGKWFIVDWIF